jgi:hypothetical protein
MLDLGWQNSWASTPQAVLFCQEDKHHPSDEGDIRGCHIVSCDICQYVYRYDSGD